MKERHYVIPIFIPDLGCPNRCVFCNQKKITGQAEVPKVDEVRNIIEEYLATIPKAKAKRIEVAFYGGSFTAIDKEEQRHYLKEAHKYIAKGKIDGIRISTRPDRIDEDILSMLMAYGVDTIELGVQSMDEEVLQAAKRGHSIEHVINGAKLIKSWGFFLGIQLMIGLPRDSQEKALKTCEKIIQLEPDFVRIYPVLVLKNTELEELYSKGEYTPWSVEDVVSTAKVMLNRFERADIEVIRIGLQNTEEITPGCELVAGPYHPAIGELIYAALTLEQLRFLLKQADIKPEEVKEVQFSISPKDESKVRGHKSENIKTLLAEYMFESIKVLPDKEIKPGNVKLSGIDGQTVDIAINREDLEL